jgi:hypothetical protein
MVAHQVLRRTEDDRVARGDNDSGAGVRLVRQIRPGSHSISLGCYIPGDADLGCRMRRPAPCEVLTGRGRPVSRTEGAERTEIVVEGHPETVSKSDDRLTPGALQHAPEGPTCF